MVQAILMRSVRAQHLLDYCCLLDLGGECCWILVTTTTTVAIATAEGWEHRNDAILTKSNRPPSDPTNVYVLVYRLGALPPGPAPPLPDAGASAAKRKSAFSAFDDWIAAAEESDSVDSVSDLSLDSEASGLESLNSNALVKTAGVSPPVR